MPIPFVGPSYALATRKADIQRSVNLMLVGMETPSKAPFMLVSVPGLVQRMSLGAEVRGTIETNDRAFVVSGNTLYEVFDDYTYVSRGTLLSSTGPVQTEYGLFQVVMVDGTNGYVFTLATNDFATISSAGFYGSASVGFIGNYFSFIRPDTQQFEISAINDATSVDALDFASAEEAPDNLVTQVVDHEDLKLFGTISCESWAVTGGADFPLSKRGGATMEVGCIAAQSVRKIDNTIFWLGRDKNGSGIVFRAEGYVPSRISTQAIEQVLRTSTDLTQARAFCYQMDGQTFYCLNAPGLTSTWVYEASTGTWHERCELDSNGNFAAWRAVCSLFAFGKHFVGDADGYLYELDRAVYTYAGDPLVRERISPHEVMGGRVRTFFNAFFLDCTTGEAPQGVDPQAELSWSNDSGATWSNPVMRSVGKVGERFARVLWTRLGFSRDRVWKLRFSANAPFDILDADSDSKLGSN